MPNATIYISPTSSPPAGWSAGSDSNNGTSKSQPKATITGALAVISGTGNTLIIADGTWTNNDSMLINDYSSATIPSGSAGAYNVIKAENAYGVRLKWTTGTLDYDDNPVRISRANYIQIDGIIFECLNGQYPPYVVEVDTDHNKITRCIVKRDKLEQYGGWFASGGNYNLFEDCAGVGGARYGFFVGGPDSNNQYNIFRRCVGRVDFANTIEPKATFCTYGNDGTTDVRYHLYQNCIALDGHNPSGPDYKYGSWYHPKNASYVYHQGCIVLNENTYYAGMFIQEWGTNISIVNSVIWNLPDSPEACGLRANTASYLTADHITIGGTISGGATYSNEGSITLTNSRTTGIPAYLVNDSSGAVIQYRYGVDGTLYGETGYNTLTGTKLWPFPYEDKIKTVFSEQLNTPSGYTPSSNTSARGFCTGNQMGGSAQTLTAYVYEFTGTQIPADVYGTTAAQYLLYIK